MSHAPCSSLREKLFIGLSRNIFVWRPIRNGHTEELLDRIYLIHPHGIVIGQQRTHLRADVIANAFLKAVLHRLDASPGQRVRRQILNALYPGQNSGHFPHGKQRFTSMKATQA